MNDEDKYIINSIKSLEDSSKGKALIVVENLVSNKEAVGRFVNNRTAIVVFKEENKSDMIVYELKEFFDKYKILGIYLEFFVEVEIEE